jgi:phage terminase small subunit
LYSIAIGILLNISSQTGLYPIENTLNIDNDKEDDEEYDNNDDDD